jgi:uncharacterized protein (TIGR00297 family)
VVQYGIKRCEKLLKLNQLGGFDVFMDWGAGLLGSGLIAAAAYSRRSLSLSGAAAAVVLGTTMFALGSLAWFGTLIAFFISSSFLSKLKAKRKAAAESGYAKGGRRDAGQVAANGGLGLLLCLGHVWWPDPLWWVLYVGVMSTVTADTWATELGGLSKKLPRSIVTGKQVAAGTSGGITFTGLVASAAGGLFIGALAWLWIQWGAPPFALSEAEDGWIGVQGGQAALSLAPLLCVGMISGLGGSLTDSWLGATLQVMYRCRSCGKEIEKHVHCEVIADQSRGFSWMTNDMVNAISSIAGAVLALLIVIGLSSL